MKQLYNISIYFYGILIRIFSLFNEKAKFFLNGRKNIFQKLQQENFSDSKIIWVHCASLGEFEQARPLIEQIKATTDYKIFLSFFSPSGYEIRKNYEKADWIYYLPLDTKQNAKQLIDLVQPKKVFFTKYEFWYYYLSELKKQDIPTFLFSSKFRENQIFFKGYGGFFREMLFCFTHIFVQDENSKHLLESIKIQNITVNGDTRFDRVIDNSKNAQQFPEIEQFKKQKPLFIIGSAWKQDLEVLIPTLNKYANEIKVIIAPHEIHPSDLEFYKKELNATTQKYTTWDKKTFDFDVLIIDTIGILSSVYQYGDFTFIGGGFGKGIHNILEAAVFGNPIVFGSNHTKFGEAVELLELNGATAISNSEEFEAIFKDLLQKEEIRTKKSEICKEFVFKNEGATAEILRLVFK